MFRRKYIFIFTLFFTLCLFTYKTSAYNIIKNNNSYISKYDNSSKTNEDDLIDLEGPIIKSVSPEKCQQYIIGEPLIIVNYSDKSNIDKSSVKLYVNYKDVTSSTTITDNNISYTQDKKFRRGNQIAKLEVCDLSPNKNKTVFEWYFTVGTPIYNHYRGLLHAHTDASDGHGSYNDAYYMARDKANLDFFAITEHSNLLDNNSESTLDTTPKSEEWTNLTSTRDKFTSNGEFIGLNGFEMTYPYKTENPIGHLNIFNSNGFITASEEYLDLDNFYKLISEDEDLIGQFNHPCKKFGLFNNFKYSSSADKIISLLEVGNGYYKNMEENIHSYDIYQFALDKGWHVGPTCSQDNHIVNFGIANEFRTVILATDLNRDNLYDALKNMRVYATEDKNIKIDYTINDTYLGSTLKNPSKLRFSISAVDNDSKDKIQEIQIISNNGEIIKSKKFNSNLAKLDFTIKPSSNKFYYVKVYQNKNKISVTAPIWIK
ncbi:MAG: CehA/McbA family metallohydrolase [Peptostreptococcaceae bacterium]